MAQQVNLKQDTQWRARFYDKWLELIERDMQAHGSFRPGTIAFAVGTFLEDQYDVECRIGVKAARQGQHLLVVSCRMEGSDRLYSNYLQTAPVEELLAYVRSEKGREEMDQCFANLAASCLDDD